MTITVLIVMQSPRDIFGGLGNQMFEFAALYGYARRNQHDIYCQDPKYFEGFEEEIKEIYRRGDIKPIDKVAIHIRRGDYLKPPHDKFHMHLGIVSYYEIAMDYFPKENFLVFSDDIDFCAEHIKGKKIDFSLEKDPIKDFNRMAGCKGHIIANSSYSWWAAFISPYTEKVVCPAEDCWFQDKVIRTRVPKSWIQISA